LSVRLIRRGSAPLYAQVREALREEISGMEPGEAIATEAALEERFGVSRITIRKALDDLAAEGLLLRQQGRGTFVQSPKLTHELNRITSWTEQLKFLGHQPYTSRVEREATEPPRRIAHMLRLEEGERVVRLRRLRLADDEPVSLMVNYLPQSLVPGLELEGIQYESLYEHLEERYGLVPATSIDTVEAREANEQEAELLGIQPWSPVIYVTRVSYLDDGAPLEVALVTSRGDRYQYKVALSGRTASADEVAAGSKKGSKNGS
jgi:GntR family transcriptional regulator